MCLSPCSDPRAALILCDNSSASNLGWLQYGQPHQNITRALQATPRATPCGRASNISRWCGIQRAAHATC